ncbi:hypothetical protein CLU82_1986 [Flavobacterium sp. 5]|nr:hypothetical protein CLU82_1986 [Flavobacterium sp. 5]
MLFLVVEFQIDIEFSIVIFSTFEIQKIIVF